MSHLAKRLLLVGLRAGGQADAMFDKPSPDSLETYLRPTGQVASFAELSQQVDDFEQIMVKYGVSIKVGSDLEAACLSVVDILQKNQRPELRDPNEDVRVVFTEILGIWSLLTKIIRHRNHPSFPQFVPHLELLNKGRVVQNKSLRTSDEASNKIFELLMALTLLDIGNDLVLDHPSLAEGNNPDILVTIDRQRWGFGCKTVYGKSAKTFWDNIKKGSEQIENSEAVIGCVLINFRNLLDHDRYWPILNAEEYRKGAEPDFGVYTDPSTIGKLINCQVTQKRDEVVKEIEAKNVENFFTGKKCIPGFLAFCQTRASKIAVGRPVPTAISALVLANFGDLQSYLPVFERMNDALHERV